MPAALDLTGQRFGDLIVEGKGDRIKSRIHWQTLCVCGTRKQVRGTALTTGNTTSCGCRAGAKKRVVALSVDGAPNGENGLQLLSTPRAAKTRGDALYYTGKPCNKGHVCPRFVGNRECTACVEERRNCPEQKAKAKIREQKYRKANPEIGRARVRRYRERNLEAVKAKETAYRKTDAYKAAYTARKARPGHYQHRRKLVVADPQQAARAALHNCMKSHLRLVGQKKTDRTVKLLGAPLSVVTAAIEALFEPGMSWDNAGEWHYDHVRPCSSFDLTDEAQALVAFNWRNLQPLWAKDNQRKSNSWTPEMETEWAQSMREAGFEGDLYLQFSETVAA